MKHKRKKNGSKVRILLLIVIILVLVGTYFFFQFKPKLNKVTVVSQIEEYDYYLESNATRLYKKYYKELEKELKDNKIDEKKYAELISKLFIIDFYTLNNKVTNKDIGGVQFIHSNLKDKFILESGESVYKYVKNNLYNNRKQKLPEVNDVEITKIDNIIYNNDIYSDQSGYEVELKIGYVKDMDYPKEAKLKIIHENNKLVIVEID